MTSPVSVGTFESAIVESSTSRQRILPSFRECFSEIIRSNPVSLPNSISLNTGCGISEGAIQSVTRKRKRDSLNRISEDPVESSENSRRVSIVKGSVCQNKRFCGSDLRYSSQESQPPEGSIHIPPNSVGNTRIFRSPFERISHQKELFLREIDVDPENSSGYNGLGIMLPRNGSIRLLNGRVMSKQDLFLKAIDLNPESSSAYNNLAIMLPDNGRIRLLNGEIMGMQDLFLKAIDLDPRRGNLYFNLGKSLPDDGTIRLLNGRIMSKSELFLKALELKAKAA